MIWFALLWLTFMALVFVMLTSKPTERACWLDKTVRLCLHISEFEREEAYVVREIKVLQMSGKAPYNTTFMKGQLAYDVVQDNVEWGHVGILALLLRL